MTAIDLSADLGLVSVFLATVNLCLGLLIAARYSPWRNWPHRQFNIFAVHNCTAYLLVASIVLHPMILLFPTITPRWRLIDVLLPVRSPIQPVANMIGAVSLYVILVVVLTSYFRLRLGRHRWKLLHYLVYVAAICFFFHGILVDPKLKGNPIDPFDGEKLFIESCLAGVVFTAIWAWRSRLRKDHYERALMIGRYRRLNDANVGD
jgi:methionine sulfoxide reductase heme-binding subunit